jgi:hypothetical protein
MEGSLLVLSVENLLSTCTKWGAMQKHTWTFACPVTCVRRSARPETPYLSTMQECMAMKCSPLGRWSDSFFVLDLNAVVDAMIVKSQDGQFWCCCNCEKTFSRRNDGKRHAEIHLDITHTCIVCHQDFRTRSALAAHYAKYHPDEVLSPWSMK